MRLLGGRLVMVALVVAGWAGGVRADDKPKAEEGYVSLFNGKDLTGWKSGNTPLDGMTETSDKRFSVADGAIVANEGRGIKDLYTVKAFNGDFNLRLEFRAGARADSGVYVRGPQLQVRDYARRGEQKQLKQFKNDGWNELDITVKGGQVLATVNGRALTNKDVLELTVTGGKPVAKLNGKEVDVGDVRVRTVAMATCLCNGEALAPTTMEVPVKSDRGIGLQAESGKFEFRNVRIKELPCTTTSAR